MSYILAIIGFIFLLIVAARILRNHEIFVALPNKQQSSPSSPEELTTEHNPVWTVVANIVREHAFGPEGKETKMGTKAFRSGTKVHIIDWYAGMAENIVVIGLSRNSRQFIKTVIRADYVEHLRVKLCYEPAVLSKIYEHFGAGNMHHLTKENAENMCDSIPVWGERFKKNIHSPAIASTKTDNISMEDQALQAFADNYKAADFVKIQFEWNGKNGQAFQDNNFDFRMKLCQYLIPQIDKINIELVRDIYLETTKASEKTFSIYRNIHIYAQELLRRDWKKYLMDYMQGGTYGIDAYMGIGQIQIDKAIAQQILEYMTGTLQTTTDDQEKKLMTTYLQRFQWLATK